MRNNESHWSHLIQSVAAILLYLNTTQWNTSDFPLLRNYSINRCTSAIQLSRHRAIVLKLMYVVSRATPPILGFGGVARGMSMTLTLTKTCVVNLGEKIINFLSHAIYVLCQLIGSTNMHTQCLRTRLATALCSDWRWRDFRFWAQFVRSKVTPILLTRSKRLSSA